MFVDVCVNVFGLGYMETTSVYLLWYGNRKKIHSPVIERYI